MNQQLYQLKSVITACSACTLRKEARLPVPYEVVDDGTEKILCVGTSPGKTDNEQNKPFVGEPGQVLEKIWKEIGFKRSDFFLTNFLKCHSSDIRPPTEREISICSDRFFSREKNLSGSRLVVTLGHLVSVHVSGVPFQNGQIVPITIGRGEEKKGAFCCTIYHPLHIVKDGSKYPEYLETWKGVKKIWEKLNAPPTEKIEDKDFIYGQAPLLDRVVKGNYLLRKNQ